MRAAYLGSQPLVSVIWAGDQQTDFSEGDGLPSIIPMGIGLGITGFPYYGHDIAGYMSQNTETTTKELFFRWVTLGALSPVMRTHHGRSARENWNWESDAETTDHFRVWTTFHAQLFPYLYGLADTAAKTGLPMMRPPALAYPEFEPGWTSTTQYMLGDRIIVAPIVEQGATSRSVELPEGTFYRIGAPGVVTGGEPITAEVALTDIAMFVPAGTLLPLLPDTVDTFAPTTDDTVTTAAELGDDRVLWVWPGGDSTFTEAGGLSYTWSATGLSSGVATASFNGETVAVTREADGDVTIEVVGSGELVINGGVAKLTIDGGDADRNVTVRIRH
jgi:alpha-glucosidase (family GH31 glycosyl hydrolase)